MKFLGMGIDIEKIDRFEEGSLELTPELIRRFLSPRELQDYEKITNKKSRTRFLVSHWVCKEAIFKALPSQDQKPLNQLEISRTPEGKLIYLTDQMTGYLSLTYYSNYCAGACFLVSNETLQPVQQPVASEEFKEAFLNFSNQMIVSIKDLIEKMKDKEEDEQNNSSY